MLSKATDTIVLNALQINFVTVRAANTTGTAVPDQTAWQTADISQDPRAQQATLRFAQPLAAGPVRLEISYSGIINDRLRGFYLSKTKTHTYGVTQFESTDARRAFPGFDEPALKATFDVTLVIDQADTAISNTEIVSDTAGPTPGKHTLRFATTPKMSTYLLAWLVGDWACSKGKSDGVPIRVCATPDKQKLTKFALEAAKWDLKYYDNYFGIKYPLKKMDLIAIPDFEAGAMENFGCLTFRETELLVDDKEGAVAAKKAVATTVAHEISHQWFGDMVTMQWWDNLWLNEGFATWMESKAAEAWMPKWKFDQDAAVDLGATMDLDAKPTTRAIRAKVETPAEIDESFDAIVYGKAGAVIGMVENWLGDEVFRKGVQEYLRAHMYGNATAEDFWNTQAQVSGQPVDKVMRSFVEQPGIPVILLGNAVNGAAAIAQKRFVLAPIAAPAAGDAEGWTLPLCMKGSGCKVIDPATKQVDVGSGLVFTDAADKGYYRTTYTTEERTALEAGVETTLAPVERIGLLSDRWALMLGGMGTVGQYLDLAIAVKNDRNTAVIDAALAKVEEIGRKIATDQEREQLNAVVRREYRPAYDALGPGSKHPSWEEADLRGTLYEALGDAGDPSITSDADRVTQQLLAGQMTKDDAIADASVALAARHGDAAMYDKLVAVAQSATDPDLKTDSLLLLTRFEQPVLVIRTLEYALGNDVRSQDAWSLIALELTRRETQDLAWQFVQQHWTDVSRKMSANGGAHLVEAAGSFCTAAKRSEVEEFFRTHPVSSEYTLRQALGSIDECVRLRAAQEPELARWLAAHGPK